MSELPSSLTVMRPISFTGAMRGPDGRSIRAGAGAGDVLDPEGGGSMLNAPTSPAASGHDDGELAPAYSSALSPSAGLQISQPITSSPLKVDRPSDRQRRMIEAARIGHATTDAAASSSAAAVAAAAPAASPSALLDGEAVEIDLEVGPDDGDDDDEVGFSAAELAGGHASHGHGQQRHHQHQQHHRHHSVSAEIEGDSHEEHKNVLQPSQSQQPRLTVEPPRNSAGYPTPMISTRTVLLHADHTEEEEADAHLSQHPPQQQLSQDFESSLPRDSTVPPMSRQKVESFDELRRKVRYKVKLLELLAAAAFVMGVTNVGVGAASLETQVLYPTLPGSTMAAGLLLVLFAPLSFLSARRFKLRELRGAYFAAGALLAFLLILGIISASKTEQSLRADVQQRWGLSGAGAATVPDGFSDDFKAKWGSEDNLVSTAWRHLTDLVIVQCIAGAVMLLLGLLTVRLSHALQRHLAVVTLATQSKSESNSKASKRAREVAAYKAKLAAGDLEAGRDLQQERIPAEVKAAKYANTPKHRATGTTPHSQGRSLATPKDGAGAGGKTPKASSGKTPKAADATAASAAHSSDRVEKLSKTPKTPKRSAGSPADIGAGLTLAEKKERKKRKKEKRDRESAALREKRRAGAGGASGGDGAATCRDVMPTIEMESSDSDREDQKV